MRGAPPTSAERIAFGCPLLCAQKADAPDSVDFLTAPTVRFQVLYVFLVLAHDRRRIRHFGVTVHPTAEWTAQQLREAFPWDCAARFLLRDRQEVLGAPGVPQQLAYVERVIGTIRRECLDHMIVFNEASMIPLA
jgi:putative transposase